ncbi:MAG: M23 family metallopeptidase [Spirochaetaceae bacterium]|nr:M23 family metallopeptidase [Spirochaetaceae bacterium]
MVSVHKYKRFENNLVQKIKKYAVVIVKGIGAGFRALFFAISRRYTIVLVPHSEKKVFSFHITFFSVFCVVLILAGIVGTFFWYGFSYRGTRGTLAAKDSLLKDTQASLDQLRDEIARLLRQTRSFQATLSDTLASIGADIPAAAASANTGDLSSFLDVRETVKGTLKEVDDIRNLTEYLGSAIDPVKEIGSIFVSQSALLTEIPNIWPIKGGVGHISMFFGQNVNPFSGQYYIHKGIDLSTYRQGDPIVTTADGQVVTIDWDPGFGNYIIIKHKHGFYTRYAHLLSVKATTGQRVQQGEVIGYIGNTGLSTGPHLHYEVHIGSDVVDPYKYLNIRSNNVRLGY